MPSVYNPTQNVLTQAQLNQAGQPGFSLSINRQSGSGGQAPQAPSGAASPMMGYGGAPRGLDSSIANGQYGSPLEITNAKNAAMAQSRQLQAQQDLAKQAQRAQLQLQQNQFNQQNAMRDSLMSSLSAVGTYGTNAPPMPRINIQQMPMQGAVPSVGHVIAPDFTAAQNAAFARAKDREGQLAQGALQGLRSTLGGRGLLGSGAEMRGTANVANRALGNLGEVNREQAIQNANAAVDQMKMGYQGDITQRGQDISQAANMNQNNLQLTQLQFQADMAEREAVRQHNAQQQQFMQNLLLGLVRA